MLLAGPDAAWDTDYAGPEVVAAPRAHRRAVEQFLAQNLHTTEGRTGVLIFISVAERYAEILADPGIHAKVPGTLARDRRRLTDQIGEDRAADGFVEPSRPSASFWRRISRPDGRPRRAAQPPDRAATGADLVIPPCCASRAQQAWRRLPADAAARRCPAPCHSTALAQAIGLALELLPCSRIVTGSR